MSNRMKTSLTEFALVLDLDSTLIYTLQDMSAYQNLRLQSDPKNSDLIPRTYQFDIVDAVAPAGTGEMTRLWGVYRPHVKEFLMFASIYFKHVYVWSAGRSKYVKGIVDLLWEDIEPKPKLIYSYENCDISGSSIKKPLSKMIADPNSGGETIDKYLVLDDVPDTFSYNTENGMGIPVYKVAPTRQGILGEDIALVQLQCWLSLQSTMMATDTRTLDKSKIFSTSLGEYYSALHTQQSQSH